MARPTNGNSHAHGERGEHPLRLREVLLRQVFESHGASSAAATALNAVMAEGIALTQQTGRESAALVDAESGDRVGDLVTGDEDRVDLGALLAARTPGRVYIQLHTHPQSSSFSDADFALLLTHHGISMMVVAGSDGTVYVMSRQPAGTAALPLVAIVEWNRLYNERLGSYGGLYDSGT